MCTATTVTPVTCTQRFPSTKVGPALLKRSLSSGHSQRQQAGMCCGSAARAACFCGSKDQTVMDLQAHPDFAKLFQVSRRKMRLLCTPTLWSREKDYLKVVETIVSTRLPEINVWKGDWKSWFKLRIVASSVALELLSLQNSPHRLKAVGSWDPPIIAASRISQKSPTHSQRGWHGKEPQDGWVAAWTCTTSTPFSPHHPLLCLCFPTQVMLCCAPEHPPCWQRGVLGSSTGLRRHALSLHASSQGYSTR